MSAPRLGLPAGIVAVLVALCGPVGAQSKDPLPSRDAPPSPSSEKAGPTESPQAKSKAPKIGVDALIAAYKREFSFLEAEKNALRRRLGKTKSKNSGRAGGLKAKIKALQDQVSALETEAQALEKAIADADTDDATAAETDELLTDALSRAQTALEGAGFDPGEVPEDYDQRVTRIGTTFSKAVRWLDQAASVRVVDGAFFLEDGSKAHGKLVKFGEVATFGVTQNAAGVLAPAGGGHLWLWPAAETEAVARQLADGKRPDTLGLFLYETLEKRVEKPEEKTWRDTVEAGGVIAWVIVYLGVVGVGLVALRVLIIGWFGLGTSWVQYRVFKGLRQNDLERAKRSVRLARTSAARVARAALRAADRDDEHLERVVTEQLLKEVPRIEFLGSIITVVAAVAPLLGLLGTVTGMISTFDIITEHGTGDPKLLSGGISEALITTELGLIVAIPTLLLGTLVGAVANRLISTLERTGLSVLNQLDDMRERLEREPPPSESEPPSTASSHDLRKSGDALAAAAGVVNAAS